jgi:TRAP-type C4-dicarboxylate transport system permease small subunit
MLQTVGNILWRAALDRPIPDTNELSAYWYLPLIAFLGYIVAQNRGDHIEATLVYNRMGRAPQVEFQVVSRAITALTLFGFAFFTFQEAMHSREIGLLAGVSDVVVWPVTFVVPVAFLVLGMQFVVAAVHVARSGNPGAGSAPDTSESLL